MIFFLALIPATMLTIAGYVVFYLAHRSEGGLQAFGKYLGFWAFTLAALVLLGAFLGAAHVGRMHGWMMRGYAGEAAQCPYRMPWRQPPPMVAPQGPPGPPAAPAPGTAPPN